MQNAKISIGVVSVSFRDKSEEEILSAARAAGLSFIEWGSDVHAPCNDIEKLKRIAELQGAYGISCSSYGTYFRFCENSISELSAYINAAKILGTDVLRLWCGKKSGDDMSVSERDILVSECKKAARIAEDNQVTLCLECHKKTFTERPSDAVRLMREVDSESFRMYWQPFQWQSVAENIKNAEAIAPYAKHIHVFNWKDKEKLPLSMAVFEWQEYLKRFSGDRTLLLEFMPNGALAELSEEASALREIIGEKQ